MNSVPGEQRWVAVRGITQDVEVPEWTSRGSDNVGARVISVTLVCVGIGLVTLMYSGIFQMGWQARWAIWLGHHARRNGCAGGSVPSECAPPGRGRPIL